jgi:hypothetical protein
MEQLELFEDFFGMYKVKREIEKTKTQEGKDNEDIFKYPSFYFDKYKNLSNEKINKEQLSLF